LAEVAESAFAKISEVAESGASGLALFGGGALALVAAFAGAAYAVATFEEHTAKANVEMAAIGQTFGTTAAGVQGLREEFAKSGLGPEILNRAMSRTAILIANSYAQIQRSAREAGTQQESAAEAIVAAHIGVESALNKDATAGTEWSLKLQSDAISVAEAWNKLQFTSADLAQSMIHDFEGIKGATLTLDQAQLKLREFQTGTKDVAAEKLLERQSLEQAVEKAKQAVADAQLKQTKDLAQAPITQARAGLGVDQAQLKQTQDVDQSFTALKTSANDVAKAFTGLAEASERQTNMQLRNLPMLEAAIKGGDKGTTSLAQTHDLVKAIEDMANQVSASGKATALEVWTQAQQAFKGGGFDMSQMQAIMQQFGFSTRGGGAAGAEAVQAFMKSKDFTDIARTAEKDPNKLQAADIAKSQEVVASSARLSAKFSEMTEKAASASGSLADFSISLKDAIRHLLEGSTPPVPGHAEGGEVRGPGTSTSDSFMRRLSDGEFVTKTAAVRFWGTDFMHAINNMELPGFAAGGLMGVRMPGKAGPASASSVVNLTIDGHHFDGLRAPQDVAEALTSYAVSRQTSAAGRRPSWDK
jgi:hypothetical protein